MTSESDEFSQRKGAAVGKTLLPSFAYSFITINRLIQCPSLYSDNLNTHLHFELPFSLQSLALQTTHSIANDSFLPPALTVSWGAPSLRASPWGAKFSWEQNPSSKRSCALGELILKSRQPSLSFSLLFCLHTVVRLLHSSSVLLPVLAFWQVFLIFVIQPPRTSLPQPLQMCKSISVCMGTPDKGGISSSSHPPCRGAASCPAALASSPVPPEGKCGSLTSLHRSRSQRLCSLCRHCHKL